MIASGFGMNIKLIGSFKPDPQTGQVTAYFRRPAAASLRKLPAAPLCLRRGLMATPTACTDLHGQRRLLPLECRARRPDLDPDLRPRIRPPRHASARARSAPSSRAWSPAPPTPTAGAHSSFTLKLDREDGDQFLGKLNFTMPPGLTANLHGVTYCPEAEIAAAARTPGRAEQADPELPGLLADRHLQRRRRARALTPSTRSARSTWPGPSRARRSVLVAITPALAGPYDYGTVVVRVALHIDPLDAHVDRRLRNRARDHRRHPDPDALDPGQHRQARTS